MPAREQNQLAIDERVVDDKDLEAALERRLRAGDDMAEARGIYKAATAEVKAAVAKLEQAVSVDGAIRCGRFRITVKELAARHVEFDADASERMTIALVES